MYLKRKIDVFLENWKAKDTRKPLILRGARQIGKTAAIRHFAERHYDHVVEINFVDSPVFKTITAEGYTPKAIIAAISRINNSFVFKPGKLPMWLEFLSFTAVGAFAAFLGTAIQAWLIAGFGVQTSTAFLVCILTSLAFNYVLRKFFIFKG